MYQDDLVIFFSKDLDTLYSLADRLLLPPLHFEDDAQAEEPMKLSILENAVFDGNVDEEQAPADVEDEFDDFTIF
jgi:hypothetical protein